MHCYGGIGRDRALVGLHDVGEDGKEVDASLDASLDSVEGGDGTGGGWKDPRIPSPERPGRAGNG